MAILASDLVAGVRSRANIERTRHVTDEEIITWLNDEGEEFYNKLIAARENYITRKATITLGVPSFSVVPTAVQVFNPDITVNNLLTSTALPFGSLLAAPSYYEILAMIVTPNAPCTTGDTQFVVKVGASETLCAVLIPDGSSAAVADSAHNVTFTASDTFLIDVYAGAGADWSVRIDLIIQPFQSQVIGNAAPLPSDFLKPVALALNLGSGNMLPIMPLDSLNERSYCEPWKHWISDQRLYIYPELNVKTGPYELDYCPRWVDLQISPFSNALMREMEQFRDIIELGAASTAKRKRKMVEDAEGLKRDQGDMIKSAIAAIPGRKGGPKQIPMPLKERMNWHNRGRTWRY